MNKPVFPSPPTRFLFIHMSGAPGGYKEAALLCERLEQAGHEAFLVSYHPENLDRYVGDSAARAVRPDQALKILQHPVPTLAVFWTNSIFNVRLAYSLSVRGAKLAVAAHEPRKKWSKVSLAFRLRRLVADAMQATICALSPYWLVFSPNGARMMRPAAEKTGAHLIELALYQKDYFDDNALLAHARDRNWVCLAGNPGGSSGHEDWPDFAREVKCAFPHLQPVLLYPDSKGGPDWLGAHDLAAAGLIKNASTISDADIRNAFTRSVAVVRLDRSCTQSGTIPVANMAGAPIIGRNIPGISQHIVPASTGFTLDDMRDRQAIRDALFAIEQDMAAFISGARLYFFENWGNNALLAGIERLAAVAAHMTGLG